MHAANARLVGRHRVQLPDEIGIERRAESNRLRKAGCAHAHVAVEAFVVKRNWNAQPTVLDEKSLDRIGELGRFSRTRSAAKIARSPDLSDAIAMAEMTGRLGGVESAVLVK